VSDAIVCTPKFLPRELWDEAARTATRINPLNHAPVERLAGVIKGFEPQRAYIAVLTTKYWQSKGVKLGVAFLDRPPAALKRRILAHMNAWGTSANVKFSAASKDAEVRIARAEAGYWSYLGTDILHIDAGQPTMNLQAFTMKTPESEFHRVVRHETGHTMGFPHEHMRRELVELIDADKAIRYFGETQGWTPDEVRQQVLTPLDEGSLLGTAHADPHSIMCYQIPEFLTKNGEPIAGGTDIDKADRAFAAKVYPKRRGNRISTG